MKTGGRKLKQSRKTMFLRGGKIAPRGKGERKPTTKRKWGQIKKTTQSWTSERETYLFL